MVVSIYSKKAVFFRKISSSFIALIFTFSIFAPSLRAEYIPGLPKPGEMVFLSSKFEPAILKGLTIHPENPLAFDFIVDRGEGVLADESFKQEADKLIKYFLAAMAIPEDKSWVNLSPYEKDRIIPDLLAQTQMGKQMLEQDYLLKQLSASLTNPDQELGKKFWDAVYKRTFELYGKTEVPISTFNKIWIVPQKAVVLEKDGHAYISESHLKVMMAEEYEAMSNQKDSAQSRAIARDQFPSTSEAIQKDNVGNGRDRCLQTVSSSIFREMILPAIEKEVNEGKSFAPVRQIYNSVILATWYKISLKETLLTKIYADKGKIKGVDIPEKDVKQKVYDQYLAAFRQGVYSIIKENYDVASQDVLPRKYFSGGFTTALSQIIEIRKGELVVGSSALRLVTVDGAFLENSGEEGFYKPITSEHRAALESTGFFKPLESKNKLTMSFEDGEVTLAYDQQNNTTYLVHMAGGKLITQMMIPGKLTDTSLIFSAFNTAEDLRNWVKKNSSLSLKISFELEGVFHTILAKALLAVDEDIDYKENPQISNVLGLMEALSGTAAVANLTSLMDKATPAQRQRILDKALSEFLVANPDFILSAAHLLGVQSKNFDLTVEKSMNGGTVISSYSLEQDLTVLIIRRGINYSSYLVQGNMQSIREAVDSFSTARGLDDFLTEIKNARIPNSGYLSQYGHVFNGEYILSAIASQRISENDFELQEKSPVNELVAGLAEDFSRDEASLPDAPPVIAQQMSVQSPPDRKKTFLQRLLPSLFKPNFAGKISAGWGRFKTFLGQYSIHKTVIVAITRKEEVIFKEVINNDGKISIEYSPKNNKTSFNVSLNGDLNSGPSINNNFRYVFAGDLSALGMDNLSVKQINKLMAITQRNGFKPQQRVDLLNALLAAEFLEDSEFLAQGIFGQKVREVLDPLNLYKLNIDKMYLEMMKTNDRQSPYLSGALAKAHFINEFLTKLLEFENREAPLEMSLNGNEEPSDHLVATDSVKFITLNGAEIGISHGRGHLLKVRFIPQPLNTIKRVFSRTYFLVVPGLDVQSLTQMIMKPKRTGQPLTGIQLQDIFELADNKDFNIFERGFIFQTLLAAAQFSDKELQRVKAVLDANKDNVGTFIPKIGRALGVNTTFVIKSGGKMEIFYNPFEHKSYVRVESKDSEGKVKTTEHVLKGDFRNDHMDSAKSIQELEQQLLALAKDIAFVKKFDGKIEIRYEAFSNDSLVSIEYKSMNGEVENNEYVLQGDWREFSFDSYRSVKEIQVQIAAVAQSQGLSAIQQQNLLRIVDVARMIKLSEFYRDNSPRIMRILKLKSENNESFVKGSREFLVFDIRTAKPRERQGYFVEFLVSQLSLHPQFFGEVAQELGVDLLEDKRTSDAVASSPTDVGGIDFDPALLDLQIKRDGRGIALPLPQQNLDQINIEGLYPVILNIQPVLMQDFPFVVSDRKSQPQIDLAVKK